MWPLSIIYDTQIKSNQIIYVSFYLQRSDMNTVCVTYDNNKYSHYAMVEIIMEAYTQFQTKKCP